MIDKSLEVFRALADEIAATTSQDDGLVILTRRSVELIPQADAAGVTEVSEKGFRTLAPTDDLAIDVDKIQYELASGPCVDAAIEERVFHSEDLRVDDRWPQFGRRAAADTGVLSMLAVRLYFEDDPALGAALNLYSRKPSAFDDVVQYAGLAMSVYGAALITSQRRGAQVVNLERALETNREIGAAIGVLMSQHRITRDQAFDLLRLASQNSHRKLAEIAHDVVDTGTLVLD